MMMMDAQVKSIIMLHATNGYVLQQAVEAVQFIHDSYHSLERLIVTVHVSCTGNQTARA
jgi:RNase adaptor protein for sRNA GlmZ degradation